jgi:hypothetical protein
VPPQGGNSTAETLKLPPLNNGTEFGAFDDDSEIGASGLSNSAIHGNLLEFTGC